MQALGLPPWLRRGLEAGVIAALVGIVTLLGSAGGGPGPHLLPKGLAGSLFLAPAVLALGVISAGYPVAFAATRSDALLGTIAAFLVSADLVAFIVTTQVLMEGLGRQMGLGVLVGVLALGPVLIGLVAGQISTRLGFGRRAGAASTVAAGASALLVLVLASRLG